jgi:hypothetical protein
VVTIALDTERATFPLQQGARRPPLQGRSFVFAAQSLLTDAPRRGGTPLAGEFRAQRGGAARGAAPVVTELMQGGAAIVEEQLPEALGRHRAEVDALLRGCGGGRTRPARRSSPRRSGRSWRHAKAPARRSAASCGQGPPSTRDARRRRQGAGRSRCASKRCARSGGRGGPDTAAHEPEMTAALAAIARDVLQSDRCTRASRLLRRVPVRRRDSPARSRARSCSRTRACEFVRAKLAEPDVRARLQRVSERIQSSSTRSATSCCSTTRARINPDLARLIRLFLLHRDAR